MNSTPLILQDISLKCTTTKTRKCYKLHLDFTLAYFSVTFRVKPGSAKMLLKMLVSDSLGLLSAIVPYPNDRTQKIMTLFQVCQMVLN